MICLCARVACIGTVNYQPSKNVNDAVYCILFYFVHLFFVAVDNGLMMSIRLVSVHLVLIQMLWLGVNTWLFLKTFLLYFTGQQYHYLYKMLGVKLNNFPHCNYYLL